MNRNRLRLALLIGLAGAVGLARMTPAWAQASVLRIPFVSEAFNECGPAGGEVVLLDGILQLVSQTTEDANGGFHTHFNVKIIAVGMGESSGARYRVSQGFSFVVNTPSSGVLSFSQTQPLLLIGQGSIPNQVIQIVDHFTVNANGATTAQVSEFRFQCH